MRWVQFTAGIDIHRDQVGGTVQRDQESNTIALDKDLAITEMGGDLDPDVLQFAAPASGRDGQ